MSVAFVGCKRPDYAAHVLQQYYVAHLLTPTAEGMGTSQVRYTISEPCIQDAASGSRPHRSRILMWVPVSRPRRQAISSIRYQRVNTAQKCGTAWIPQQFAQWVPQPVLQSGRLQCSRLPHPTASWYRATGFTTNHHRLIVYIKLSVPTNLVLSTISNNLGPMLSYPARSTSSCST